MVIVPLPPRESHGHVHEEDPDPIDPPSAVVEQLTQYRKRYALFARRDVG